jgi:ribosomal protein S18 acetylase RimI-like enzyme
VGGGEKGGRIMDSIEVVVQSVNKRTLEKYSQIPISYEVQSILNVELIGDGLKGMVFQRQEVASSYIKNYDQQELPTSWPDKFDTSNWRLFLAFKDKKHVGGIIVAYKTPGVYMLDGRDDLAVVWDIRVLSDYRHKGIGTILFQKAIAWSRDKHCRQLKVETQNVNVAACEFYIKQGCKLGAINRYAYRGDSLSKREVQLLWYLDL